MLDILSTRGLDRVREFVRDRVLLAFDFDGTLAPLATMTQDIAMSDFTAGALQSLQARHPMAIIADRSAGDVRSRLRGATIHMVIGNHGIEPSSFMAEAAQCVERWGPLIEQAMMHTPGVRVENKSYSMAIHYGDVKSAAVLAAIRTAAQSLPEAVRLVEGQHAVNIMPAGAPDKGAALRRAERHYSVDCSLFVGDDVTDEDVFRVLDPARSIGVRVGRTKSSAAPYFVKGQAQVETLLDALVTLSATAGSAPQRQRST